MAEDILLNTQKLLAEVWQKNQPLLHERLSVLDAAAHAADSDPLPEDLRTSAESTAHKLAGSLGMFGYHTGTTIARELEQELQQPSPDPSRLRLMASQLRSLIFPASS